jgi:TolB-like protein
MQYRGVHKPLPEIARELNVDAVVEGTVVRSGGEVRITAQLIQASTDRHLWSQRYQLSWLAPVRISAFATLTWMDE